MSYLGTLNAPPDTIKRSVTGNQICLIVYDKSQNTPHNVGDIFTLKYNDKLYNFKIIDMWNTPKDFAIKFLWRLCGKPSQESMIQMLTNASASDMIRVIFYTRSYGDDKENIDIVKLEQLL